MAQVKHHLIISMSDSLSQDGNGSLGGGELHDMIRCGNVKKIKMLANSLNCEYESERMDRELHSKDTSGRTPLALAIEIHNLELIKVLLADAKAACSIFVNGSAQTLACTLPGSSNFQHLPLSAAVFELIDDELKSYISRLSLGSSFGPLYTSEKTACSDCLELGDLVILRPGVYKSSVLLSERGCDNEGAGRACLGAATLGRRGVVLQSSLLPEAGAEGTVKVADVCTGFVAEYATSELLFADGSALLQANGEILDDEDDCQTEDSPLFQTGDAVMLTAEVTPSEPILLPLGFINISGLSSTFASFCGVYNQVRDQTHLGLPVYKHESRASVIELMGPAEPCVWALKPTQSSSTSYGKSFSGANGLASTLWKENDEHTLGTKTWTVNPGIKVAQTEQTVGPMHKGLTHGFSKGKCGTVKVFKVCGCGCGQQENVVYIAGDDGSYHLCLPEDLKHVFRVGDLVKPSGPWNACACGVQVKPEWSKCLSCGLERSKEAPKEKIEIFVVVSIYPVPLHAASSQRGIILSSIFNCGVPTRQWIAQACDLTRVRQEDIQLRAGDCVKLSLGTTVAVTGVDSSSKCLGLPADARWGVVLNAGVIRKSVQRNIQVAFQQASGEPVVSLFCASELRPVSRNELCTARDKELLLGSLEALFKSTNLRLNAQHLFDKFGFDVFSKLWAMFEGKASYDTACEAFFGWQALLMDEDVLSLQVKAALNTKQGMPHPFRHSTSEEPDFWLCRYCQTENALKTSQCLVCNEDITRVTCPGRCGGLENLAWHKECKHCHASLADALHKDSNHHGNALVQFADIQMDPTKPSASSPCEGRSVLVSQGAHKNFAGCVISSQEYRLSSRKVVLLKHSPTVDTQDAAAAAAAAGSSAGAGKRAKGNTTLRDLIAACFDGAGNRPMTIGNLLSSLVAKGMLSQQRKAGEVQRKKVKDLALEMLQEHYSGIQSVGFSLFCRHQGETQIGEVRDSQKLKDAWSRLGCADQQKFEAGNIPGQPETTKCWPSSFANEDGALELLQVPASMIVCTASAALDASSEAPDAESNASCWALGAVVTLIGDQVGKHSLTVGCIKSIDAAKREASVCFYAGPELLLSAGGDGQPSMVGKKVRLSLRYVDQFARPSEAKRGGRLLPGDVGEVQMETEGNESSFLVQHLGANRSTAVAQWYPHAALALLTPQTSLHSPASSSCVNSVSSSSSECRAPPPSWLKVVGFDHPSREHEDVYLLSVGLLVLGQPAWQGVKHPHKWICAAPKLLPGSSQEATWCIKSCSFLHQNKAHVTMSGLAAWPDSLVSKVGALRWSTSLTVKAMTFEQLDDFFAADSCRGVFEGYFFQTTGTQGKGYYKVAKCVALKLDELQILRPEPLSCVPTAVLPQYPSWLLASHVQTSQDQTATLLPQGLLRKSEAPVFQLAEAALFAGDENVLSISLASAVRSQRNNGMTDVQVSTGLVNIVPADRTHFDAITSLDQLVALRDTDGNTVAHYLAGAPLPKTLEELYRVAKKATDLKYAVNKRFETPHLLASKLSAQELPLNSNTTTLHSALCKGKLLPSQALIRKALLCPSDYDTPAGLLCDVRDALLSEHGGMKAVELAGQSNQLQAKLYAALAMMSLFGLKQVQMQLDTYLTELESAAHDVVLDPAYYVCVYRMHVKSAGRNKGHRHKAALALTCLRCFPVFARHYVTDSDDLDCRARSEGLLDGDYCSDDDDDDLEAEGADSPAKEWQTAKSDHQLRSPSMDELIKLTGLHEIKKKAMHVVKEVLLAKKRPAGIDAGMSMNFLFTGNPGCGKTTVAKLLAGAMHELRFRTNKTVVETSAQELLQAIDPVDDIRTKLLAATGGCLFIDGNAHAHTHTHTHARTVTHADERACTCTVLRALFPCFSWQFREFLRHPTALMVLTLENA